MEITSWILVVLILIAIKLFQINFGISTLISMFSEDDDEDDQNNIDLDELANKVKDLINKK